MIIRILAVLKNSVGLKEKEFNKYFCHTKRSHRDLNWDCSIQSMGPLREICKKLSSNLKDIRTQYNWGLLFLKFFEQVDSPADTNTI